MLFPVISLFNLYFQESYMKKAVVLFALAACFLLAGQDRATSATSNLQNVKGETLAEQGGGTGPAPLCTPQCPLLVSR
jgi:hypothetical protein